MLYVMTALKNVWCLRILDSLALFNLMRVRVVADNNNRNNWIRRSITACNQQPKSTTLIPFRAQLFLYAKNVASLLVSVKNTVKYAKNASVPSTTIAQCSTAASGNTIVHYFCSILSFNPFKYRYVYTCYLLNYYKVGSNTTILCMCPFCWCCGRWRWGWLGSTGTSWL